MSVDAFGPAEVGANATETVHDAPGARVAALHVSCVRGNWLPSAPEAVTLPSVYAAVSSLVIVTVCAAPAGPTRPAKVSALAENARSRPVPVMFALVSGGPLLTIVRVVVLAPVAVGENATTAVHVWPWASTVPAAHVPASVNCGASAPFSRTSWTVRASVPVLVSV